MWKSSCYVVLFFAGLAVACSKGENAGEKAGGKVPGPPSGQVTPEPAEAESPPVLNVYSGRTEALVAPVIAEFEKQSGMKVEVKYAGSAELAATLEKEGERSPADVFFAQDASTLGYLQEKGLLSTLPETILARVGKSAKSPEGQWVGVTGRSRVLAYNKTRLKPEDLPKSSTELTDSKWQGRVGWAPENASFQSAVSAMIQLEGSEATAAWVAAMQKNQPRAYPKNTPAVLAVSRGEVDVALVNHYYLYRLRAEHGDDFPVANHYFRSGKADSLINVSGAAIVASSQRKQAAEKFISHLLSDGAQRFFTTKNYEFPLVSGVETPLDLPDISTLNPPVVDLAKLSALKSAHDILRTAGALR